jgi:predicted metalloprotease with PDZ domain
MKKLLIVSLLSFSFSTFASEVVANLFAYTLAEAMYSTAIPVGTSAATSATSQKSLKEALELKNDIQDYYQSGLMGPKLLNKVILVQSLDNSLSLDESLDALVEAANLILK